MSEDEDGENGTSFTMRMIFSGIRAKFPTVNQLNSDTLFSWLQLQQQPHETAASVETGANENGFTTEDSDLDTNSKVVVLDTRPENEFRVSHINGAIQIDPEVEDVTPALREIIASNKETSLTVVCYCSLGYRSSKITERLSKTYAKIKRGDRDIPSIEFHNLEGSLFKWANEGKPMVDMYNKPTIYAHPFSVVWGKLLNKPLRKSSVSTV